MYRKWSRTTSAVTGNVTLTDFDDVAEHGGRVNRRAVPPFVLELILALLDSELGALAHVAHHRSVLGAERALVSRQRVELIAVGQLAQRGVLDWAGREGPGSG